MSGAEPEQAVSDRDPLTHDEESQNRIGDRIVTGKKVLHGSAIFGSNTGRR